MNAVFQQAILIIDTVLVGGLGEEALVAMGIAASLSAIILGFIFAMASGAQILLAQAFGAVNQVALRSGFWSALVVGCCIACIGVCLIFLFHETVIGLLAKTTAIAAMSSDYLLVFTVVILGVAVCQNISVYFYSTGKPKLPFYSKLLELPVNALISLVLIYGLLGMPEMGLRGAAVGSAIAVLLRMCFLVFALFATGQGFLWSAGASSQPFLQMVRKHLKNALPIAGTFISMNLAFSVCMMLYSQLSVYEFAAVSVIIIWMRTAGQLYNAWAQSIGIIVGQLLGQNRNVLLDTFVSRAWRIALMLGFSVAAILSATPVLFQWFYPELKQQTIDVVWSLLPVLVLIPLARTSNTVCGNVLRAGGQAAYAFKVHVIAQWLFTVPVTALLVLYWQVSAFWVVGIILVEEILKGVPFHLRTFSGVWKQRLVVE